jgi:3-methyladenine DNA glycosylase/8-oxoguanine DNA glycosylase
MNRDGPTAATLTLPLRGAGGEPVSLRATLASHGLAWLPPNDIGLDERTLTTTLRLGDGKARTLAMHESVPGILSIFVDGRRPSASRMREIAQAVRAMFALDDDLAPFYASLANDAELAFAIAGYGRLLRSPTAFEDIVRTICTTNCAWSATERMIGALVAHLGTAAPLAEPGGWRGHAFPTAEQLAAADDAFFRDTMRAGYRGTYLRAFAAAVASGDLEVEAWRLARRPELSDAELEQLLLALPGVGPYAAAHVMMLFGRCSRLGLDSWTRPRYAQLLDKKIVSDKTILRRFKRYGQNAGLAFWLLLWKSRHLGDEVR